MDVIVERCAGLDVHRDNVVATVRVPGSGRRQSEKQTKTFNATLAGLAELALWLAEARRDLGRDGGHGRVLEDGVPGARGSVRVLATQRAPLAQRGVGLALRLLSDVVLEQSSLVGFDLDS